MIILGIDPGIATMGYGVVEKDVNGNCRAVDYGVVLTPKEETLPVRLAVLEEGLNKIIDRYAPEEISLEELFFTKNITTGIAVAHARGVILLSCVKKCGRLYEYTPMQIKQALTGYGRADKKQIQEVVASLLRLKNIPRPDDAADALAIALCHAFTSRFGGLFAVENSTHTKGKNAVTGSNFQSMMEEETGKRPKAKAGSPQARGAAKTAEKLGRPQKTSAVGAGSETVSKAISGRNKDRRTAKPVSGAAEEIARRVVMKMNGQPEERPTDKADRI